MSVSYTHLRAHETDSYLVCRLLLEKKGNSFLGIISSTKAPAASLRLMLMLEGKKLLREADRNLLYILLQWTYMGASVTHLFSS